VGLDFEKCSFFLPSTQKLKKVERSVVEGLDFLDKKPAFGDGN
jgi:hypothetical protein